MGTTNDSPDAPVHAVVARLLSGGVSCLTAWWTYKVWSVLFEKDDTFNSGDPFVIVLLPFFIVFLIVILGLIAFLVFVSVVSAAYAFHPPLAGWILGRLNEPPKSE